MLFQNWETTGDSFVFCCIKLNYFTTHNKAATNKSNKTMQHFSSDIYLNTYSN